MEGFQGSETALYANTMVDTCQYAFVNTYRMNNTKREL